MARNRKKNRTHSAKPGHNLDPHNVPFNAQLAIDIVDNPNKHDGAAPRISVTRSIRNDPIAGLYARSQIDMAQYHAGRKWQAYYDAAGIGLVIAMDPLKEPVDGRGATRSDFSDAQLYAFHKLKEARAVLGLEGDAIIHDVLGDGMSIADVAMKRGLSSQLSVRYYGMRFRECLEALAVAWGLAGGANTRPGLHRRPSTPSVDCNSKSPHP